MSISHPAALPHDPPREILPDVLYVHGSVRLGPGLYVNRNMVVLRHEGELVVLNAVRLTPPGEKTLEEFGRVRHVVRLGVSHGIDDPYYVERFGAEFWCQEGSDRHPKPKPTQAMRAGTTLPIPDADLFLFRETKLPEAAVLLRRHGGVLLTCDSIQHWQNTSRCSLLAVPLCHLMGFVQPANIGPPWKRMMTKPGGSLRPDFERILQLDFENLIGAHGQPLLGGAREAFQATVEREF